MDLEQPLSMGRAPLSNEYTDSKWRQAREYEYNLSETILCKLRAKSIILDTCIHDRWPSFLILARNQNIRQLFTNELSYERRRTLANPTHDKHFKQLLLMRIALDSLYRQWSA